MDPNRLTEIPIFSELSADEAKRLATFATETSAAEGQMLMKEGDYSVELIAIEEGTADVIQDGKKVASLEAGRPDRRDGPAGAPPAQRRRDRHLADAADQADPLGDPADVRDTVNRIKATIEERRRKRCSPSPGTTPTDRRASRTAGVPSACLASRCLVRCRIAESPDCRLGERGTQFVGANLAVIRGKRS